MPTFDTPAPIEARLHFGFVVANVRVTAEPRADTEIEVRPVDAGRKADQRVAEQTRIDFAGGVLTVQAPKLSSFFGRTGAVDVRLRLPETSGLAGETGMGEVVTEGRLGEVRFKTGYGDLRVEQADEVYVKSSSGDVTIGEAGGAEVVASNGRVDVGRVAGAVRVQHSNGASRIGEASGEVTVRASNGVVSVERAYGDVTVRTANGRIEIGEVVRGTVTLETAAGSLAVGVREGTAAWLDLSASAGQVRNELAVGDAPAGDDETVSITARTSVGNITVRRAR
jgi:hypothetical protein